MCPAPPRRALGRRRVALAAVVALLCCLIGPSPMATAAGTVTAQAVPTVSSRLFPLTVGGSTLKLEYYGNGDVLVPDPIIKTVVLVIHGDSRNAADYARYSVESSQSAGVASSTLVVAPHFIADSDSAARIASRLYWSEGGWKQGDKSQSDTYLRPWRMSSFAVLDAFVAKVAAFPNMTRIVVAGHSAGGQFVNRYAAGTQSTVKRTYVVANPSSYLYFSAKRWRNGVLRSLTSSEARSCPGFDHFKYGLREPNAAMVAVGAATLGARYSSARVTYLLGAEDTDPNSASLDTSCAAKWQGSARYQRGSQFHAYLGTVFGQAVYERHKLVRVPGVAHDGHEMLMSPGGRSALFGTAAAAPAR